MINESKEKILFVDDEESILEISSEYFEQKGYHVFTARNGVEALSILDIEKIDCCFTDINMPEMDGLELAEHIRMKDNTIPVIIMTGYPSLDNTIRTLKNGVVDFLIKPVNLNQMELSVRRVLRERQLFVKNIFLTQEVEGKKRLEKINQELLYKIEEVNNLNRIMTSFAKTRTSSDVFKRTVDMALEIIHADESRFYIVNQAMERPVPIYDSRFADNDGIIPGAIISYESDEELKTNALIMEMVTDEIPLLVTKNKSNQRLPENIKSFMLVPMKIREKVFGAVSAAITNGSERHFSEKDLYYLSFMTQTAAYAVENLALYENIYENLIKTLYALVNAIEARDPYTLQHSNRVTHIAVTVAEAMSCSLEEQEILKVAGLLHDIGKIGIRDDILLKPGPLTEEEYNVIKMHSALGANIVGQLGLWDREQQIIRCHHERYDGKGYPDGLKGNEVPLLARILSVADVYDALDSDRSYRKKMDPKEIISIITEGRGSQFDPEIVDVFLKLFEEGRISKIQKKMN